MPVTGVCVGHVMGNLASNIATTGKPIMKPGQSGGFGDQNAKTSVILIGSVVLVVSAVEALCLPLPELM